MRLWRQLQRYGYVLIAVGIALLIIGLRQLGGLQGAELKAFDRQVRHHTSKDGLSEVVVVGITETDIRSYNRWPLSDGTVAELLAKLQTYDPKVIGLDIYRDIEHPPGQGRLQRQLAKENVYGVYDLGIGVDPDSSSPAPIGMTPDRTGFADFVADTDGVVRRNFMFASVKPDDFYSLGLRVSLHVLRDRYGPNIFDPKGTGLNIAGQLFPTLDANTGGYQNEDMAGYQVLLQYKTQNDGIRQVSLRNVLDDQVDPAWFKDKVVLIGTVAPSIKDIFFTPFTRNSSSVGMTPGVVIHAHVVNQILSIVEKKYSLIWTWNQWQEKCWILLWCLIGGGLAWHIQSLVRLLLTSAIAMLTLTAIGWGLFALDGWIPTIPPALGFSLVASATIAYQVFYRTFYDSLTSLPNRFSSIKQLQHHLDQQNDSKAMVALLLIDLGRFKAVNESLGEKVADRLLQIVAERIVYHLPKASVARVGSDQFIAILPSIHHPQTATDITEHLRSNLMDSISINGNPVKTTISIGIAFHPKGKNYPAHALLQDAYHALGKAKNKGRNSQAIFQEDMRTHSVSQFQLEMDLRDAGEDQQFQLYYQPILDLNIGKIAGFEALIRWQHPNRGLVPPIEFIEIAEDTGMILAMGEWILKEACSQVQQWQQQFPQQPPLFIGVNLSSRQFLQPNLATTIANIVHHYRLDPRGLKLELTESVAMNDVDSAIQQLTYLKDEGLHISLDDFGTGYSSLSYLHRLPIDSLKIDKSFVDRMETNQENENIVGTIVTLAQRLNLDIVAEGVETIDQARLLKGLQCQYAQGYYFSKPVPRNQATKLLSQNKIWQIDDV
ncbi:EAL domain-containing protein [Leptothoe kymatousa TAU-MAC 1615]|uniref:EAL domain-containing protein n=1 Tax=Leptothoe kymatousa TAU-MAC 1615 TaxID=2364775 RepID=A0ABS5Y7Q1_9CYAN|nr:EAL domain-containing protein [Leptothoe kymatousa TAU-MAC 1615]